MKIYISADMEGISGITHKKFLSPGAEEYERGRKLMAGDVNAAIEGALLAGAEEIVVNDAHGTMRNLCIEDIHPAARLISGYPKPQMMMCGLDASFDGAMFIGYHSRSGSGGVLSHTISGGVFQNISYNGRPAGEFAINAALAGAYGVPVILVSGDDCLQEEVKEWNPAIGYAVTKKAVNWSCADCLHPEVSARRIKEAAEKMVKGCREVPPVALKELDVEITYKYSGYSLVSASIPGVEMVDAVTSRFHAADPIEAVDLLMAVSNASNVYSNGLY